MPRDDDIRRGTEELEKEVGKVETGRAKRINSLTTKMSEMMKEENRKRLQVSNEISSLTKQQQKAMKELEMMRSEFTTETTSAFNRVIKGLGHAMESFAVGIKNITTDTAKASGEAIRQYGRVIGEDISINKVNTVAMALSTATPLFGYFAAKFMETDIFQDTAARIKGRIGDAVQQGLSSIGNIFRKKPPKGEVESEELSAITFDLEEIKTKLDKDLPTMQKGGLVTKGGVVKVHTAEVITPIDKFLGKIEYGKEKARYEERKSLVSTFIKALQQEEEEGGDKWQQRIVQAINELKVALIGTSSRFRIALQRTLLEHPSLRMMLLVGDALRTGILAPLKYLFGIKGGYAGAVRGAMSSGNMFQNIANLLGMIYSNGMLKIDTIIINLKKIVKLLGGEAGEAKEETWTKFERIRSWWLKEKRPEGLGPKKSFGTGILDMLTEQMELDPEALKKAGLESIFDLLHPFKALGKMGVTKKNVWERIKGETKTVVDDLSSIRKMKEAQEEREGPGSPTMAENIANTAKVTEEAEDRQKKADEKQQETLGGIYEESKQQTSFLGRAWGLWKKASKQIWSWIFIGLSFLKDAFFTATKGIIDVIMGLSDSLLMFLGLKGFRKGAGTGKVLGKGGKIRGALGGAGAWAGKTKGGKLAVGGLKFASKALALGATAATAGIGLGIEGIMGAFQAEEWGVGKFSAIVGSMLGGAGEGGFGSMVWGAIKGAMLGSVIPGAGTLIGAVVGAALGLIGGKNIAKAHNALWNIVKKITSIPFKIVKGIWSVIGKTLRIVWNIIMLPFRSMYELVSDVWGWLWKKLKAGASKAYEWASGALAEGWSRLKDVVKIPFDIISSVINKVKEWLKVPGFLQDIVNSIVNVISSLIMPIVGLVRKIKDWVVDKLSGIPLVGRILKMVYSEFTKEGGTTYQELYRQSQKIAEEAAAEKAGKPLNPPTEYVRASLSQETIAKNEAKKQAKIMEKEREQWAGFTDTLTEAVSEGNKQVSAAVVNSTNVMTQSNANLVHSNNFGRGAAEFSVSSGDRSVYDLQVCNVQ